VEEQQRMLEELRSSRWMHSERSWELGSGGLALGVLAAIGMGTVLVLLVLLAWAALSSRDSRAEGSSSGAGKELAGTARVLLTIASPLRCVSVCVWVCVCVCGGGWGCV
jgi:hypothetical protein